MERRSIPGLNRNEWAAHAEHFVRTSCYASQRVSAQPSEWLSEAELVEARALAVAVVKATRTALTRAGRASERSSLNAAGREAASPYADVNELAHAWLHITRTAASVEAAPEQAARLAALVKQMRSGRDAAAEAALQAAITREVARRNSDAGWQQELVRRARIAAGPTVTTIRV